MAEDKNDIDEWLDEVDTDDDGELDQLNIDALLGAADSDESDSEEMDQTNIDALFDLPGEDSADDDASSAELDQGNIDALLGGLDEEEKDEPQEEVAELDQDNIDALFASDDDESEGEQEELDQDNIDALFDNDEKDAPAEEMAELDQDNIDSLFDNADDNDPGEEMEELDQDNIDSLFDNADDNDPGEEMEELDQDNIDSLFDNAADGQEEAAAPPSESDDEDIDALFNDIDAASGESATDDGSLDELFSEDDGEEKTHLSTEDSEELASAAFDSDFDEMDQLFSELEEDDSSEADPFETEEIDFAEMLEEDDDGGDDFLDLSNEEDTDSSAEEAPSAEEEEATTGLADILADAEEKEEQEGGTGMPLPAVIAGMGKTALASIGGGVIILLLIGLYFLFGGSKTTDDIETTAQMHQPDQENPTETSPAAVATNFIPLVEDASYTMAKQGGEVAVTLSGQDEDGQPLIFAITNSPQHGRLSGTAPNLTYLPNRNFPGEDHFEFTASDGKDVSTLATVTIAGPDLGALARAQEQKNATESRRKIAKKKVFKPTKPQVLAKNVTYYTTSTEPVIIDWERIWQEANKDGFNPETHVEIISNSGQGVLSKIDTSNHSYRPDPYSDSTDHITYRFKRGGFRSPLKTITIDVELGSPAPEVNFAQLEERYAVGQKVVIDASPSRDEQRQDLQFSWQQISGVEVVMTPLNKEGSQVAFVMPSSFYTGKNSGPTFRVFAQDASGKISSGEISVQAISRRQTALWRGDRSTGGMTDDPAMSGRYFPWPYDD